MWTQWRSVNVDTLVALSYWQVAAVAAGSFTAGVALTLAALGVLFGD